ncbi:hypothetical protein MHAEM_21521 [Mycolicibacterium phlei]|nr:hypothetical protein [Mycolicibacterium phlei]
MLHILTPEKPPRETKENDMTDPTPEEVLAAEAAMQRAMDRAQKRTGDVVHRRWERDGVVVEEIPVTPVTDEDLADDEDVLTPGDFKPGDRVRITGGGGLHGTVEGVAEDHGWQILDVAWDDDEERRIAWHEDEVEMVNHIVERTPTEIVGPQELREGDIIVLSDESDEAQQGPHYVAGVAYAPQHRAWEITLDNGLALFAVKSDVFTREITGEE